MAAETNGLYGNQYGQPVELAASTPSQPHHASSASVASNATSTTAAPKADPQEIGWYFVEQYYTTLSKTPEKIHLFYSKKSQLVTGIEAEKVVPAVGTKAISEKIKALDIQDCKVRVLNVDSQASFHNIVVQVIGEMSNKSEPHHKFVQTFVLAEQPNGYFVLNDIFRYLNNDEDEIVDDEPVQEEVSQDEQVSPIDAPADVPATEEDVTTEAAVEEVDTKLEDAASTKDQAETSVIDEAVEASVADEPAVVDNTTETTQDIVDEPQAPLPADEQPIEPEPTPVASPPKAATPTPAAEAPPAKKTWASMVGTKALALPALPVAASTPSVPKSQRSPQPSAASAAPKAAAEPVAALSDVTATSNNQNPSNGWQNVDSGKKQNRPQPKGGEAVTLAYIKNVNDKVDARILREVLEKYGELKYFDVSRPRNCAFVEFATTEGYTAAVGANPHDVGGETIYVEERRPRPTAYGGSNAPFTRGGANTARGGRGAGMGDRSGSRGGSFTKDAPRGGFQQRGAKTGNVTPRGGRGQAQAV